MAGELYRILQWVKEKGEVKAIDRIRLKVLTHCLKEKVYLSQVGPHTECSPELLEKIRQAAEEIVGEEVPF